MASIAVGEERLKAGADYLAALRKIGFEPDGLFWAWDKTDDDFVLVLVSKFFDIAGPLKLSELLFRACRMSVTPRTIDPFRLRLHSPDQTWIRNLIQSLEGLKLEGREVDDVTVEFGGAHGTDEKTEIDFGDYAIDVPVRLIYKLSRASRDAEDLLRNWRRVERNLEEMAV